MDILGGLAFTVLIIAQFAAVIAVRAERESREMTIAPPRMDHRARLIWESGY